MRRVNSKCGRLPDQQRFIGAYCGILVLSGKCAVLPDGEISPAVGLFRAVVQFTVFSPVGELTLLPILPPGLIAFLDLVAALYSG